MPDSPMDRQTAMKRLKEEFGDRLGMLGYTLIMLSQTGQPCDLTFFKRKPMLDIVIDQRLALSILYGAGPKKLQELLTNLRLRSGTIVDSTDIWTIHPMPKNGFTQEELDAVDMAQAEDRVGPRGETLRKMIRDTYHCTSVEEEDKFIQRFLAS